MISWFKSYLHSRTQCISIGGKLSDPCSLDSGIRQGSVLVQFKFCLYDLKWNALVEFVIAKAAKRLFALRLLKRAGVMPKEILKVYLSNDRSVLEYAAQVWQHIPAYLSHAIILVRIYTKKSFENNFS